MSLRIKKKQTKKDLVPSIFVPKTHSVILRKVKYKFVYSEERCSK
uniref:Uncharacterized protein n=1 Tax=Lepeophtheirus salmonis TaxID=72036 RepID=A0A0K2UFN3_LEPSM